MMAAKSQSTHVTASRPKAVPHAHAVAADNLNVLEKASSSFFSFTLMTSECENSLGLYAVYSRKGLERRDHLSASAKYLAKLAT